MSSSKFSIKQAEVDYRQTTKQATADESPQGSGHSQQKHKITKSVSYTVNTEDQGHMPRAVKRRGVLHFCFMDTTDYQVTCLQFTGECFIFTKRNARVRAQTHTVQMCLGRSIKIIVPTHQFGEERLQDTKCALKFVEAT